jgi:hypothetical protein
MLWGALYYRLLHSQYAGEFIPETVHRQKLLKGVTYAILSLIGHEPYAKTRQGRSNSRPCPFSALFPISYAQVSKSSARFREAVASSRNEASFAVALNCGIGSSSLNALVNALERLQVVLGANSSTRGSKY